MKNKIAKKLVELKKFLIKNLDTILPFFILLIFYLFWLYNFWPGVLTTDSIIQWRQSVNAEYSNAHPFVSTLTLSFFRIFSESPGLIAFAQVLISASLGAWSFRYFSRRKVPFFILVPFFIFFLIQPAIAIYNVTILKDVLFSQLIYLLGILFLVHSEKNWLDTISPKVLGLLAVFSLIVIYVSSLRHNGIIFVFIIPAIYCLTGIFKIKRSIIFSIFVIGIYFFFQNFIAFTVLDISRNNGVYDHLQRISVVGAILKDDKEVLPNEREVIEKYAPIKEIGEAYSCNSVRWISDIENEKRSMFRDKRWKDEFVEVTNSLIIRNLPEAVGDRACMFANIIGITDDADALYFTTLRPNEFGITKDRGQYEENIKIFLSDSTEGIYKILFWSPFIPIVFMLLGLVQSIYTHNKKLFGFTIIIFSTAGVIALANVSDNFRYLYMLHFALPWYCLLMYHSWQEYRESSNKA